jgi:hypothetical protein
MESRAERTETHRLRWELMLARVGGELDKLIDDSVDVESRIEAANTVFSLYCSVMSRAQELEDFAEDWIVGDVYLAGRLDRIRLEFPLPVASWDDVPEPQ